MQRDGQISNIRAFAILSVVLGHSMIIYSPNWNIYTTQYTSVFFNNIKEIINVYQMALFLAMSGYLFYNSVHKSGFMYKQYVLKKVQRTLVPFIVIGLLFFIPVRLLAEYSSYEGSYIKALYQFVVKGDYGHLWFLPALMWMLLASPLIYNSLKKYKHANQIFLFVAFAISLISKILKLPNFLAFNLACDLYVYFVFGFCLNPLSTAIRNFHRNIKIASFVVLTSFIIVKLFILDSGEFVSICNFSIALLVILICFMVFPKKTNAITDNIDKNSYAIYLFHSPFIYLMYNNLSHLQPFLLVSINVIVAFVGSIVIASAIRIINMSFILGE